MKKIVLDKLTIKQKIKLFNQLYNDIADCGINGDTELAHVNKYEAAVLRAMGGSGTINKCTNLVQYFGGGKSPPPPPTEQTVKQVSDLPEYAKPYVERLFARAEEAYQEPYVPYTGQRLAEVTPEQRVAFSGLESFLTEVDPVTGERTFKAPAQQELDIAKGLASQGVAGLGDISAAQLQEKYMSPFQQAVTDIQKREFAKEATRREQQRAALAGKAGAFGGSRDVLERMLGEEATQRGLSDIQAAGSQKAYESALQQFRADQAAKMAGAAQFAQLGQSEQALGLSGLGALQAAGEAQRGLEQQPLDIAYEEFARQQTYPLQQIQDLSGVYRGFQMQPSTYKTAATYQAPPSLGQQLLGAGSVAAGIASGLGKPLFGAAEGGLVELAKGGMVEKYQEGGYSLSDAQRQFIDQFVSKEEGYKIPSEEFEMEDIAEEEISPEDLMNLPGESFPGKSLLKLGIGSTENYKKYLKEKAQKKQEEEYKKYLDIFSEQEPADEGDSLNIFDIADLPLSSDLSKPKEKGDKPKQEDKKEKPFFNLEAALPYFQAAAQFTRPGQDTATAALAGLKEFASAKKLMREAETEAEKRKIDKQYKQALARQALAQAEYMKKKPYIDFSKLKSEERDKLIESFTKQKEAYIKAQADSSGNPALVDKYQTVINELDVLLKRAMESKYGNLFTSTNPPRATEKK